MSVTVKICGLSTPEALDVALDAGADMVGFVFFPPSPRNLSFKAAGSLEARVRGQAKKVALSVDADDTLLAYVVDALGPDFLQLHGNESPLRVAAIKAQFKLPVIKAIPVESRSDLAAIARYAMSLAPVTWVVISEIFPNRIRGAAMSTAVSALWIACFLLTYTFPILNGKLGSAGTFCLYAIICLAGFVFIRFNLPETKGKSLEQIEKELM